MDGEADECASDAATTCKRLKRANSTEVDGCDEKPTGQVEVAETGCTENSTIGVTSALSQEKDVPVRSSDGEQSSSRLFSCPAPVEVSLAEDIKDPAVEPKTNPQPEPSMRTLDGGPDTMPTDTLTSSAIDDNSSGDDDIEFSAHTFNRPRAHRTRSYRSTGSTNIESSSSSSNGSSDQEDNGSNNNSEASDIDVNEAMQQAENSEDDASLSSDLLMDESSSESSNTSWNRDYDSDEADDGQIEKAVNVLLGKTKPPYNWNLDQQLMRREHNLFNRIGWRGGQTSALSFGYGYYASRQVVERMKLMDALKSHRSCVNCLSFNSVGDLICSGSDDLSIVVWDWANSRARHSFKSGHNLNIFQTKFIDSTGVLDIVSSSRDGQVRRAVFPPSGSTSIKPKILYCHSDAVHKLVVVPQSRHEIISVSEDAAIRCFDLRTNKVTMMQRCTTTEGNRPVRLFCISHHPFASEICVTGSDEKLRVYDKRNLNSKPVHEMIPSKLKDIKMQITCAVYNYSGSEILASYSDDAIYLYDSRNYKDGEFLHSYEGHINSRTIKGVNFFGPRSEYVISGSDCGNVFFWDKNTEAIINFAKGDQTGVVNCLEQHPWMPVLATSGLDLNVKVWAPSSQVEPEGPRLEKLKETIQRNCRRRILELGDFDINQYLRHLGRTAAAAANAALGQRGRAHNLFGSSSNSSNSSNSSSSNISSTSGNIGSEAANEEHQRARREHFSSSDEGNGGDPLDCRPQ